MNTRKKKIPLSIVKQCNRLPNKNETDGFQVMTGHSLSRPEQPGLATELLLWKVRLEIFGDPFPSELSYGLMILYPKYRSEA